MEERTLSGSVKNIGLLTSGGDAPGMNAAIRAVVRAATVCGIRVTGIRRGFQGLLEEDFKTLGAGDVCDIIGRGGTCLYTARSMEFKESHGVSKAAEILAKHKIDALIVIGGDGSFRGARELSKYGINVVGIPATIDMDIACTDYAIGFDTAVNTAIEAADKIRDTSTSHEGISVIEVMGRNAGYIALWCGMGSGAEDILIPEFYDGDEEKICEHIKKDRIKGKKHHIIINAEGIGDTAGLAKRLEAATGIKARVSILGYIQRGGNPTARDRIYSSLMGKKAVDILMEGKTCRIIVHRDGIFTDMDIDQAMDEERGMDRSIYETAEILSV